jgi:hemolysin activation/secretion protein
VTAQFINKPLTRVELLQVEAVLTKYYNEAGYIYSRASIPADQSFPSQGGIIKIRIIEGGIAEIKVTGTKIQTPNQELGLGLSLFRQENNTKVEGQPFPLSPGADRDGKTIISGLRFFKTMYNAVQKKSCYCVLNLVWE